MLENVFGLAGLALLVFAVAVWKLGPDWGGLAASVGHPAVPVREDVWSYAYYGVALFGAAMTPYEVFFFSSGGVEEGWTVKDLPVQRANVLLGFPLGGDVVVDIEDLLAKMACLIQQFGQGLEPLTRLRRHRQQRAVRQRWQ